MSSGEKWRKQVAEGGSKYDWLGSAREIVARGYNPAEPSHVDLVPVYDRPLVAVPKPGRRSTDLFHNGSSGRDKCAKERMCRMCQRTVGELPRDDVVRQITRHHLVPLRWFVREGQAFRAVRNANANIIPLCRPCHDLIEGGRDKTARRQARRMLRQVLTQKEVAFAVRLRGIQWLDATYPLR